MHSRHPMPLRYATFLRLTMICSCLALMVSSVSWGQTEIDRQVKASADGRIYVESFAGSLVIRGWQENTVKVTGTLGRDIEGLEIVERGRNISIEVQFDKRRNLSRNSAHLEIQVPRGSRVDVETVSAEVTFDGINGELEAETVSGDLSVEGAPRSVSLETVSGEVDIVSATEQLQIDTVSGDVRLVGVGGEVSVTTVSGDVDLLPEGLRRLDAEIVSGDLEFKGVLEAGSEMDIASHSGDVTLYLPSSTSANFEVETFSGSIRNALGPPAKRVDRYTPGKELKFKMGDGKARVQVESFSGLVDLRSRD